MERSPSPSVVVFDLGGVLVPAEGALDALADELDVPAQALAIAYWRFRDDYDRGGDPAQFWNSVSAAVGRTADPARLDEIDAASWSELATGVPELLAELGSAGVVLAVLSNAPASLASTVRAATWSSAFDRLLFSSDVGTMKPEAAIFEQSLAGLGVAAAEVVFLDDRPVNVAAARAQGWRAEVWTDLAAGRALLADHGLPVVSTRG